MKNIIKLPSRTADPHKPEFHFNFQEDREEESSKMSIPNLPDDWMQTFVRLVGIVLLLFGLWTGIKVMLEGFTLYQNPIKIEAFAQAIENGSNIDKGLAPETGNEYAQDDFRLSYFAAWFIVLSLLMFVSMIAFTAIKTGGELALYDTKIKQPKKRLPEVSKTQI